MVWGSALLLAWLVQATDPTNPALPLSEIVKEFEARVELPAGSLRISDYARYYASLPDDTGVLSAVWVGSRAGDPEFPPGVHLDAPVPTLLTHSGCAGVIRFTIQPDGESYEGLCDPLRPVPPPPPSDRPPVDKPPVVPESAPETGAS